MYEASGVFLDYNNDGHLDLLVVGKNSALQTNLYKNSGAPDYNLILDTSNSLVGIRTGGDSNSRRNLSAVDINNDGWVDLFTEGWCESLNTRVVILYKNVAGIFVKQTTPVGGTADFEGMTGGSIHTGDVNHDGYADMICSGYSVSGNFATNLYINQGNGTFVKSIVALPGIEAGESVLVDLNNDGWLDIFVAGVGHDGSNWIWPGNLYLNNQDGTFTMATGTNLPSGKQYLEVAQGDVNNDGKTDMMQMNMGNGNTAVYYNNGDNTFTMDIPQNVGRARNGSLDLADFNNDNKLDYFAFGYRDGYTFPDNAVIDGGWASSFVKNTIAVANLAPAVPANLSATKVSGKYLIAWDISTDDITPQNAIRYNIYILNETGKVFTYSPASLVTGRLKTGSPILLNTNQITLDLPVGEYSVGVQAVDQANVGSAFITTNISITTKVENLLTSTVDVKTINKMIEVQNNGLQKVDVSLISLSGQSLYKGFCVAGSKIMLPMNLNQGVYLVKLSQNNTTQTVKVSVL